MSTSNCPKREIIDISKPSRRVLVIGREKDPKRTFDIRREGKDRKNRDHNSGLAPSITINTKKPVDIFGRKINTADEISFGLGQNIIPFRINSFKDFPKSFKDFGNP